MVLEGIILSAACALARGLFFNEDGVVYHTYSTYARGVDGLWGNVSMARSRS
jgi:hypothetical protein